jgi:cytochrome c oxidase assembly protein subunit 11
MPWKFWVENGKLEVHPGQINEAVFIASNQTNQTMTGQAIPSVAPGEASLYFKKIECFCFTQQTLGPGESKRMPVKFVVKPEMPDNIHMLTLSYTFFPVSSPAEPKSSQPVPSS